VLRADFSEDRRLRWITALVRDASACLADLIVDRPFVLFVGRVAGIDADAASGDLGVHGSSAVPSSGSRSR
jgi:hypothetical protein